MKRQKITLNEAFEYPTSNGIFQTLQAFEVPWSSDNIAHELDRMYHFNRSGDKPISTMVRKTLINGLLTPIGKSACAETALAMYLVNWVKIYETLDLVYNPIENYRMVETMSNDNTEITYGHTNTETLNTNHHKTGTEALLHGTTEQRTDNLHESISESGTDTDTTTNNTTDTTTYNTTESELGSSDIYGFNSSDPVGADTDSKSTNKTGTETLGKSGTITDQKVISHTNTKDNTGTTTNAVTGTDTTTYNTTDTDGGTTTNAESGKDTHKHSYELTRSGNIGVTTSQQMLQSERDLWQLWNFFEQVVYKDLDKILVLPIYQ